MSIKNLLMPKAGAKCESVQQTGLSLMTDCRLVVHVSLT
jgi:hypothetical protein